MAIKTMSFNVYEDLQTKVHADVKADSTSTAAKLDVTRAIYIALGGKLSEDGIAAGKGIGASLSHPKYLSVFGSKDSSGYSLYSARVAYGREHGEVDNDTADCPLHQNARDYLRRIKGSIKSYVDGRIVFPKAPKAAKSKAAAEKREARHAVKMASDPKYAAAHNAKVANEAEAGKVIETFEVFHAGATAHLDRIQSRVTENSKGPRAKLSKANLDTIQECTAFLESVTGVLEGKLVTRAKPKKRYTRKSTSK